MLVMNKPIKFANVEINTVKVDDDCYITSESIAKLVHLPEETIIKDLKGIIGLITYTYDKKSAKQYVAYPLSCATQVLLKYAGKQNIYALSLLGAVFQADLSRSITEAPSKNSYSLGWIPPNVLVTNT